MKEVYVVYESNYGDLIFECENTNILGVFDTEDKARERLEKEIGKYTLTDEYDFVLDEGDKIYYENKENMVRLFYKEQENWSSYFELYISKEEVL